MSALATHSKPSRWPTADKKRSGPPGPSFASAISGGQSRTQAVKCGQNLLLSPLVRQGSRSEFGDVPWPNADKMETTALAELAENAEENVKRLCCDDVLLAS